MVVNDPDLVSRARRGEIGVDEDASVPESLDSMGPLAKTFPLEMQLFGLLHPAEVVMDGDALRSQCLEPMRAARGPSELGLPAGPRGFAMGFQLEPAAHGATLRPQPHPYGPAPAIYEVEGSIGDDNVHGLRLPALLLRAV